MNRTSQQIPQKNSPAKPEPIVSEPVVREPIVSEEVRQHLQTLQQMGFTNVQLNIETLAACDNDLQQTILRLL